MTGNTETKNDLATNLSGALKSALAGAPASMFGSPTSREISFDDLPGSTLKSIAKQAKLDETFDAIRDNFKSSGLKYGSGSSFSAFLDKCSSIDETRCCLMELSECLAAAVQTVDDLSEMIAAYGAAYDAVALLSKKVPDMPSDVQLELLEKVEAILAQNFILELSSPKTLPVEIAKEYIRTALRLKSLESDADWARRSILQLA